MDDQALHVGDIGQQREDRQVVDELPRFLLPAFDVEGEDRSASVREILLIQRVVGVIRKRRMVDFFHQRMLRKEFGVSFPRFLFYKIFYSWL